MECAAWRVLWTTLELKNCCVLRNPGRPRALTCVRMEWQTGMRRQDVAARGGFHAEKPPCEGEEALPRSR